MINTRAPDGANKLASIDRTLVALLITGVDITVCDIVGIVLKKKYTQTSYSSLRIMPTIDVIQVWSTFYHILVDIN